MAGEKLGSKEVNHEGLGESDLKCDLSSKKSADQLLENLKISKLPEELLKLDDYVMFRVNLMYQLEQIQKGESLTSLFSDMNLDSMDKEELSTQISDKEAKTAIDVLFGKSKGELTRKDVFGLYNYIQEPENQKKIRKWCKNRKMEIRFRKLDKQDKIGGLTDLLGSIKTINQGLSIIEEMQSNLESSKINKFGLNKNMDDLFDILKQYFNPDEAYFLIYSTSFIFPTSFVFNGHLGESINRDLTEDQDEEIIEAGKFIEWLGKIKKIMLFKRNFLAIKVKNLSITEVNLLNFGGIGESGVEDIISKQWKELYSEAFVGYIETAWNDRLQSWISMDLAKTLKYSLGYGMLNLNENKLGKEGVKELAKAWSQSGNSRSFFKTLKDRLKKKKPGMLLNLNENKPGMTIDLGENKHDIDDKNVLNDGPMPREGIDLNLGHIRHETGSEGEIDLNLGDIGHEGVADILPDDENKSE